ERLTFTIQVTNWDAPGTPPSRFTLATPALAAGFTATFTPSVVGPLAVGEKASATLVLASPADLDRFSLAADFPVEIAVANEQAPAFVAHATVVDPVVPYLSVVPALGFTVNPSSQATGTLQLRAIVAGRGAPLAGTRVGFTLVSPGGAVETFAGTTGP